MDASESSAESTAESTAESGAARREQPGETVTVTDADGVTIYVSRWEAAAPHSIVHVVHGLGEHAQRYGRLATALTGAGYSVYADDHRGHGRTGEAQGGQGPLGARGMAGTLDAIHTVSQFAQAEHPGLPLVLVGHSWGSLLAQKFVLQWGSELHALVLTGTRLMVPPFADMTTFNAGFAPSVTPYDWLSRDAAEVAKYMADPWCGFSPDFPVEELATLTGPPSSAVPSSLPILIMNGSVDPVGGEAGGMALAAAYRDVGVRDVTFCCYPEARHEVFNETNRDEVTADLLAWIEARP
jgi:alpha-beta hydrolase superfamily lysophospholipase